MRRKQSSITRIFVFLVTISLLLSLAYQLAAQEQPAPTSQLFITDTNASSPPTLELQVYGITPQGEPLQLASEALTLRHNDLPVSNYEFGGTKEVGTFTVFLIDIPGGVASQFPAIQNVIQQYAGTPVMKEQVDAVAIYQVGEDGPRQLLAPDRFYNSVTNFFSNPLTASTGATALIDSTVNLLQQIPELKPDPAMAAALVVISDGTDAVSSQFQADDVAARATELGIPIHTISLTNEDLPPAGQQQGQDYLTQVASDSRGLAVKIENATDWAIIWNRITGFRNQAIIRYQVPELQGGTFPVELGLMNEPEVTAVAEIDVPTNMPSIVIDLSEESRTLTLPSLEAETLHFTTSVRWLDGVERTLTAAQLVVNGVPQELPVADIADFTAELTNLIFGANTIQVAVLDDQGMRATSPIITVLVNEGRRDVPDELDAGGGFVQSFVRVLVIILILAILGGGLYFVWRQGLLANMPALLPHGRSRRRGDRPRVTYEVAEDEDGPRVFARLVVLDAISEMPPEMPLIGVQVRLGRSPQQADIAFENDITVSRLHATMMLEGVNYRIFDEGSTSGTWVNEKQVPEYGIQLTDGDEIHLGAVHLRFYQP
ncbi:MAG: FHA domain-containing protein [Anaerolineales bacterium]|nr:FHA domain-containing protein [Anaerolineales bacterium]MCB8991694.1 FHA domain-containing protein [Ardenticatenaceae bacterium]MCB9005542.1 FHA domain-containing protein [Ardenticatenaceae bacterium]